MVSLPPGVCVVHTIHAVVIMADKIPPAVQAVLIPLCLLKLI